jgi:electron transport complex protein RnfD
MENIIIKHNISLALTFGAIVFMACYYYGMRSLNLVLISMLYAFIIERFTMVFYGIKRFARQDFSWAFTGVSIALLCPATIPLWVLFVANFVAIFIAKFPFGGKDNYIFNPTAVGICFVSLSFSDVFFTYPASFTPFSIVADKLEELTTSPALIMLKGGTPRLSIAETFLGNFAGSIGTTSILVLFACGVFLIYNKVIAWEIPVLTLSVVGLLSAIFPRLSTEFYMSILFEISIGTLLFGIIFIATDYQTIPKTFKGKVLFGIILGIVTMLFKYFSKIQDSFLFAVLIMNALSNSCDKLGDFLTVDLTSKIKITYPKKEVENCD